MNSLSTPDVRVAAAEAGRAETAPLAREGDDPVAAAGVAVDTEKALGEDAALEEAAKLPLHESWQGPVTLASQEGLQLRSDELIENGLLRAMARVGGGS